MKTKVKDELLQFSSDESTSEDDEDACKLTDEVEKEFFKTLSHIKSKDPKIYKKDIEFFKEVIPEEKPKEKSKPLTLREYERKIVVEKGGELSDEEPHVKNMTEMSYVEEQRALKNSLKNLLQSDSEYESEAEWGGLFKKRQKTKTEEDKDEEDYKDWLKGQKSEAPDEEVSKDLKPLRDFWTNPDLNEGEQFLRDYVLNKRFLDADEKEVNVEKIGDESDIEENNQLDKIHTHRFEEQDQEFIKRYPRVMENSVRRKDDSRRRKREEIKERKQKEKEKKRVEIKQKQKLKKKEIEQKLEELKQLTGNDKLAFENVLDKDFDIDEYDKEMQRLFNEEFYSQDDPNFNPDDRPDCEADWIDDEVDVKYEDKTEDVKCEGQFGDSNEEPQCEDPDFNMDCDYDPAAEVLKEKTSRSRRRKDKHRRTTVSEAVKREKPVFDPATHKSYQEYLDQYYGIDCEDFIGDLPCRFKYRRTIPNSYGLTIEEILAADPKELERWCSIKRIIQLKPSFREKGDAMSYKSRAANEELKRKILPSLYTKPDEVKSETIEDGTSEQDTQTKVGNLNVKNNVPSTKKRFSENNKTDMSKKRKLVASEMILAPNKRRKISPEQRKSLKTSKNKELLKNNKKKVHQNGTNEKSSLLDMSDARLQAYGIKPKKFRNKLKYNGMDSSKIKPEKKIGGKSHKMKKSGMKGNLSDCEKTEKSQFLATKINSKKNKGKNKLTKKNTNGWTVSNAS